MIYLNEQLRFLQFLQEGRGPIIDLFFRSLHFFDSTIYATALSLFIWIVYSSRWGMRLGFLLIANGLTNHLVKGFFAYPRPQFFDASLPLVQVDGFSFPSGGAQMSILLALVFVRFSKNRWAWPIAIFYTLLISFSRMFLGVHFPLDVLGGWVLGAIVFWVFIKSFRPIESFCKKDPKVALGLSLGFMTGIALIFPEPKVFFLMGIAALTAIGIKISS